LLALFHRTPTMQAQVSEPTSTRTECGGVPWYWSSFGVRRGPWLRTRSDPGSEACASSSVLKHLERLLTKIGPDADLGHTCWVSGVWEGTQHPKAHCVCVAAALEVLAQRFLTAITVWLQPAHFLLFEGVLTVQLGQAQPQFEHTYETVSDSSVSCPHRHA